METNPARQPTCIEGSVETVTYHNPENLFTIARLRVTPSGTQVTIKGAMLRPRSGEILRVTGIWETHARYGQQLRVETLETVLPAGVEGVREHLARGAIHGVGPKIADRLVAHFKDQTLTIIERQPQRLTEVPGIGPATAGRIAAGWRTRNSLSAVIRFLQDHGVQTTHATKIHQAYGEKALEILTSDPFRLAEDLPRVGFVIADAISRAAGAAADDPMRIKACILHVLSDAAEDGNTCTLRSDLAERCKRIFDISANILEKSLATLADKGFVTLEEPPEAADAGERCVFLMPLARAESGVADRLAALLSFPARRPTLNREQIRQRVLQDLAIELSPRQLAVVDEILDHRVAIVSGGPGTGKTTLIRSVAAVFESLGRRVLLAAPTGRAARRLSEVTGRNACTIHRLLGYHPAQDLFERNLDDPLQTDVVVIDEASMVDVVLMHHLLQAVHVTTRLVLVGDEFQLPSVGPGNVLSDLIRTPRIPTFQLSEIFRQASESAIIRNAHRIRQGLPPELTAPNPPEGTSDFYVVDRRRPEEVLETVERLCCSDIPEHFALDPIDDIQVITPMHKGTVGTLNLNRILQQRLNPATESVGRNGPAFRPGDKVMHLKNNYRKDVYNGDSGRLCELDLKNRIAAVDYDGRIVEYDFRELEDLSLAYAITVHKAQGSEFPAVVIPLVTQHFVMLQRNLLYTAVTRGRKLVVLVGHPRAVEIALSNDRPRQRLSGLFRRLTER